MEDTEARPLLAAARVGRLATCGTDGIPHVVPVVFVLEGDTIYWAVDRKPKRSTDLKRLRNLEVNPNAEIVVDDYDEDWSRLRWVRASGRARLVEQAGERERALGLLAAKYPQYGEEPPDGPVVAVEVARWSTWEASPVR